MYDHSRTKGGVARSEVTTGDITTHPRRRLATLSPNVLRRFHLRHRSHLRRRSRLRRREVGVGPIFGVVLSSLVRPWRYDVIVGLVFGVVKSASVPSSASVSSWRRSRLRRRGVGIGPIFGAVLSSLVCLWRHDVVVDFVLGVVKSASIPSSVSRCRCQFGSILVSDDPIGRVRVGGYSEGFFPEEVRRGFPRRGITKRRSWRRRVKKRR